MNCFTLEERRPCPPPVPEAAPIERLTLRLAEIAKALGISRRALERERSAGRMPRPDLTLGRMPLWRVKTIREWIERGGKS
jgi:predicted DNA-binding transcriptional regulator AlpA